jgi:hypothetical protein
MFNTNLKGSASVLVKSNDFSPLLGSLAIREEGKQADQLPTFGGGPAGNSGSNSNNTGALNSMI